MQVEPVPRVVHRLDQETLGTLLQDPIQGKPVFTEITKHNHAIKEEF